MPDHTRTADSPAATHSLADRTATPGGEGVSVSPAPSSASERYTLGAEIARGGMGVVYRATDTVLGREVAVKVLLARFAPGSPTARRFADEARIAAQLQHPGIPPIHDLGTLSDGRPFLAMKLIKGDTLDELLKHRPDPAVDRGRYVAAFEQICHAIAYAHAHQVIHRDLKPSNVMVGSFSEVQVMDWGLAKVLGTRPIGEADPEATAAGGTEIRSLRDSDGSETQAGSVMGTPAFMPPEQAVGAVDKTDARSDVFGLGGILAVILTGQPPFSGDSAETTRVKAALGDVADCLTRLDTCGAEPELVALCKKCLSPKPADRPTDAGEVARSVAGLRQAADERARLAELDRAATATRTAEGKKRRRVWAGATAAVAVAVIGGLTAVAAVGQAKNAELQTERDIARNAEADARARGEEANRQRELAQKRLETASAAIEQVMTRVAGEKWAQRPELLTERQEVLEEAIDFFKRLGSDESKDPTVRVQAARANLLAGTAYLTLADYDQCRTATTTAREMYQGLQADFPTDSAFVRGEAETHSLLGHADSIAARFSTALNHYEAALKLAERAVALDADRVENQVLQADCYSSLALFYSFQRPDLSRNYHAKALAIGERLLGRGTIAFRVRLLTLTALINLGVSELGPQPAAAAEKFDRAERLVRAMELVPPPDSRSADLYISCKAGLAVYQGVRLVRAKKTEEGLTRIRTGIQILDKQIAAQPKSFSHKTQSVQFRVVLMDNLLNTNQLAEAKAELKRVIELQSEIAREQPQLTWVKGLGQVQRSNLLIHQLREKFDPGFEDEAKELLEIPGTIPTAAVRYNIACLYAQAAGLAPEADRPKYAEKAVVLLNKILKETDYFWVPLNANHIDKDPDLDPIRQRPDYTEFAKKAKAEPARYQKPRQKE
jgi:tetratricopeptide (TPR) repeat protein